MLSVLLTHLAALGFHGNELINELPLATWYWPVAAWVPAVLAGVPALLLARSSRVEFARAAGRGWLLALLCGAALGTVRLIPFSHHEAYLGVFALVAAGIVAGVVALMWSANPKLIGRVEETTALLRRSVKPPSPATSGSCGGRAAAAGAGIIDAQAAVTAARAVTG